MRCNNEISCSAANTIHLDIEPRHDTPSRSVLTRRSGANTSKRTGVMSSQVRHNVRTLDVLPIESSVNEPRR